MMDRGCQLSIFWGIHLRTDIRINIFISIRGMSNKFAKQVHLEDSTQMRLIKQMLVVSSRQIMWKTKTYLHYESVYGYQTWQDGD